MVSNPQIQHVLCASQALYLQTSSPGLHISCNTKHLCVFLVNLSCAWFLPLPCSRAPLSWQTWLSDYRMWYMPSHMSSKSPSLSRGTAARRWPLSPHTLWPSVRTGWGVECVHTSFVVSPAQTVGNHLQYATVIASHKRASYWSYKGTMAKPAFLFSTWQFSPLVIMPAKQWLIMKVFKSFA